MVKADVEIGGTDQLFNLKAGREIQKKFEQMSQDIITLTMLNGLDDRKMSTSWGNVINITDEPNDIYGKVMSMKDLLIDEYLRLATRLSKEEIEEIKKSLNNPRDIKARLAKEIVTLYHGKIKAEIAEEEFNKVFRNKQIPSEIEIFKTDKKTYPVLDLLFDAKIVLSKNEAKRLIQGGAVTMEIDNKKSKIDNWKKTVDTKDNMVIKAGRKFIKIKII